MEREGAQFISLAVQELLLERRGAFEALMDILLLDYFYFHWRIGLRG